MGMFDYIVCHYPLPGNPPKWIDTDHHFQTKDLDCVMQTYTIEADGTFSNKDFFGQIELYTSNIVGSGPGYYTANGEDAECVTYVAKVANGKLLDIKETEHSIDPALPASTMDRDIIKQISQEQVDARKARQQEPMIGKQVYVLWGGQLVGYHATVVAESKRQICVQVRGKSEHHDDGDLEIIDRWSRDTIFFDSEHEAMEDAWKRQREWAVKQAQYDALVEKRKITKEGNRVQEEGRCC